MDISLATSIYELAKVVKNNKISADAERVIEKYSAFQKNNPSLPTIAPFCRLDHYGPIRLLTPHGEEKIDTIIDALEPLIPKFNDEECLKGKTAIHSRAFNEPVVVKFYDEKKLSSLLDTFLKVTDYKETEWIEFKTDFLRRESDYLGKLFSGLSNSACLKNVQYAYLVYGVNESKRVINGTKFSTDSEVWQTTEEKLRQNFVPDLNYEIIEFNYKENPQQHIIIFKIQAANAKPIAYCGKTFIRQDDKTIPLEDFPNLLKILSNPPQKPIIDNSIPAILQSPQFFFLVNPQIANTASNNPKKTTENTDNKSNKLDIKGIIAIILAVLAIPFSGFAVKSCGEDEGNINQTNKSISVQDNSSNQSSLKIISGDNSNINISVGEKLSSVPTSNETTENKTNTKDSSHKLSEMINNANEDLNRENSTNTFIINQQYLITAKNIFKLANSIIPNNEKSSGLLEGLINRYNAFAKKAKLDPVKEYDSVYDRDYTMDRIAAPGIAKLNEIILNLRTYIDIAEMEMKKNRRVF